MAHRRRDPRRENFVRHLLLARTIRRASLSRYFYDPERRPGVLRRPDWRLAGRHSFFSTQEAASVETGGYHGAQHRPGIRVRPHRLPAQRLLLWPRVQPAMARHLSGAARDSSCRWNRDTRSSHASLRFPTESGLVSVPGVAVSAQEVRWPGLCRVSDLLRLHALVR